MMSISEPVGAVDAPHRVLLTGASGALGRALTTELLVAGVCVTGLVRAKSSPAPFSATRLRVADLREADWPALVAGESVAFHLAAYVHRGVSSERDLRELHEVNVDATARLARACRAAGVKLVFASSVAVYDGGEGTATDDTAPAPRTPYGQTKLAAEEAIRSEGERGLRYTILRFPLLYGPHGRGNMERMLRAIGRRRYVPIGDPDTPKACLHFADAARALRAAAERPTADGTYVVAPHAIGTLGEIHAAAFEAMGCWRPPHVPLRAARLAAFTGDILLRLGGRGASLLKSVDTLTKPSRFDGTRFALASGFRDRVSLHEGMRLTARWMREATR
ncbi:NAD-dependent epimerase/dehydratase [Anaeromyxobacter sp. K]|uniref:NAD-dependent epimerase/dehydratase family protein n=1 Tax=Anaeromyxobacter sp. (strain K) TaxID=447217 RepID=UPI00017BE410|nr:NAD-dependent epimerase/dehydratase family protein [Anaeromyxobacter sp. K]ACG75617.1 NAD-dependent epimerase/dehydratase [Anaeromyxobacter sp. K]